MCIIVRKYCFLYDHVWFLLISNRWKQVLLDFIYYIQKLLFIDFPLIYTREDSNIESVNKSIWKAYSITYSKVAKYLTCISLRAFNEERMERVCVHPFSLHTYIISNASYVSCMSFLTIHRVQSIFNTLQFYEFCDTCRP